MANRRVPEAEQAIFRKYAPSPNMRRLTKDEALYMFQSEYFVKKQQAEVLFDHFDADKNGQLSLWEFHHFCTVVGNNVPDVVGKYSSYDADNKDSITVEQTREGLEDLTKETGPDLEQKEWDFFLKTAAIENGAVPLGKFIDLYARLKQFKRQKAKSN